MYSLVCVPFLFHNILFIYEKSQVIANTLCALFSEPSKLLDFDSTVMSELKIL